MSVSPKVFWSHPWYMTEAVEIAYFQLNNLV